MGFEARRRYAPAAFSVGQPLEEALRRQSYITSYLVNMSAEQMDEAEADGWDSTGDSQKRR